MPKVLNGKQEHGIQSRNAGEKKASDVMESSFTAEHAIEEAARCADRYSLHEALGLVVKVTLNRIK